MSGSEFTSNLNVSSYDDGWKECVPLESKRFLFYKTRVYGALQLLKQPRPEFAEDILTIESLRKEFYIAFRLNHPSIARYYRFENNRLYEEYVDGVTLRQLIEADDSRLEDARFVRSLMSQLFDALDYLHKNGIVHRDIKPENLMVAHIGDRLKIIDFGGAESAECDSTPGFTAENLAPEQTNGKASFQTDIYQAGRVAAAMMRKSSRRGEWRNFVIRATHPDPRKRFQSAAEAIEALPSERKRGRRMAIGLIFALVSVLIAGYILTSRLTVKEQGVSEFTESQASADPSASEQPKDMAAGEAPELAQVAQSVRASVDVAMAPTPAVKAEESVEKRLANEINRFVTDAFSSRLKKLCDETPTLDDKGFIVTDKLREFDALFTEAQNKSFEFGDALASKHPAQRDFIEETLIRKVESTGSVYMMRFYRPNETAVENLGL